MAVTHLKRWLPQACYRNLCFFFVFFCCCCFVLYLDRYSYLSGGSATPRALRFLPALTGTAACMAVSHSAGIVFSASLDRYSCLSGGQPLRGHCLLCQPWQVQLLVWRSATLRELSSLPALTGTATCLAFSHSAVCQPLQVQLATCPAVNHSTFIVFSTSLDR
jgi:hypothetical protein